MNTNMAVTSDAIHMLPGIYLTECTHWRSLLDDLAWLLLAFVVNFRIQSWTEIVDCSMVVQSISSNYDDGEKKCQSGSHASLNETDEFLCFCSKSGSTQFWIEPFFRLSGRRRRRQAPVTRDTGMRVSVRGIIDWYSIVSGRRLEKDTCRWLAGDERRLHRFSFFFFFRFLQFLQLPQCLPPFRMVVGLAYLSFQRCEQLKMVEGGGDSCWTHQLVKL